MNDALANLAIEVTADTSAAKAQLLELEKLGTRFSSRFATAFERAVFKGRDFGDVLRGLAQDLSRLAFRAAFEPIQQAGASFLGQSMPSVLPFAKGGIVSSTPSPFAKGGVLSAPALFPMAGGRMGVAGEAGAEAILPLARGPDGRLGVRAQGSQPHVSIAFNITTPDAESFRRSEGQIAAMIARAVRRGERNL